MSRTKEEGDWKACDCLHCGQGIVVRDKKPERMGAEAGP